MTLPAPIHDVRIGDGRVCAWDDLLSGPSLRQLHQVLDKSPYTRNEIARADTAEFRHWAMEIPLDLVDRMPIHAPAFEAAAFFEPGRRFRLYRCYVNVAHYGDMLFSHEDCRPGAGELTGLWYVCERWDHEWGGETMFFDATKDVRAAIQPRPGRFALFNGDITHAGRPPNRICHAPRYTLAMKFEPIG